MSYDLRHVERVKGNIRKAFCLAGEDRKEFAKCIGAPLREANRWINFALDLNTQNKACPHTYCFAAICEFLEEEGGEKSLPSVFKRNLIVKKKNTLKL